MGWENGGVTIFADCQAMNTNSTFSPSTATIAVAIAITTTTIMTINTMACVFVPPISLGDWDLVIGLWILTVELI